ncbi:hypothetical protein O181_061781 [Austropuccinia psidii MF-1]|uniref:Uncharacterized protein n=1 Tax=Austropuccinia psidii MF-1 TaxID=1389203 RepID=A0A9Q3ENH1_9BASI|nr:hypothetical protein [Austropuccinia psidii MF-1]
MLNTRILMLEQHPNMSNAITYTFPGSGKFTHNSSGFYRIMTVQTQILTPVQDQKASNANPTLFQDPDGSNAIPHTCPGSGQFTCSSLRSYRI